MPLRSSTRRARCSTPTRRRRACSGCPSRRSSTPTCSAGCTTTTCRRSGPTSAKRLEKPGVPVKNAFRLRHNDGTWRHIESVGVNRLDDPGIRGIIINYRDITESRRAEEALREGEVRYRQLTEQASDIIYNCDLEGRFTFVNPTGTRLMKFTEQELIGRHFLSLIRNDYRERAAEFYTRQREQYIRSTYFEFPAIAKDGSELWLGPERADCRGARHAGGRAGDRARHHGAARAGGSAAPGAEDGGDRPPGRRRRARFQQRVDGDSRLGRSAVDDARAGRSEVGRGRRHQARGRSRSGADQAPARLQPPATRCGHGRRSRRDRQEHGADAPPAGARQNRDPRDVRRVLPFTCAPTKPRSTRSC